MLTSRWRQQPYHRPTGMCSRTLKLDQGTLQAGAMAVQIRNGLSLTVAGNPG
jgi:hypothetical protein